MRSGRKAKADLTPLSFQASRYKSAGRAFEAFCERYIRVPKGVGARQPLKIRPWQKEIVDAALDDGVSIALVSIARGQGKSTLLAALCLFHICTYGEGARAVVVAIDERSSIRLLKIAARMVELSPELSERITVYKDKLIYAATDSTMIALPGEAHRVEGEDATLGLIDEIGFVRRDTYEALLHSLKREGSRVLAIGTPSPPSWREASPMLDLLQEGRNGGSPDFRLIEHSGDITHPVTCEHCWESANPGLDDIVLRDNLRNSLPPRSRESEYRRARLGQWVDVDDKQLLPPGVWDGLCTGEVIEPGSDVVLALDGSYSHDATAIIVATVDTHPHVDVGGLWTPPTDNEGYRVPILEVEDRIRQLAKTYNVVELTADPFRWSRSLQLLEAEGLTVSEFSQQPRRLTPATSDFIQACIEGELTHSGNPDLAAHVKAAVLMEDTNGARLQKERRRTTRRVDLAAALVMAHSRATWRATRTKKSKRTRSFAA